MGGAARYALARSLGQAAARLSRLAGAGRGTTIGGRVILAVDPGALTRAAAGRRFALVSGTNGKTTTRTLLTAALATLGPVVSNAGGANLPSGLTAALAGDPGPRTGVLEVDEPFLPVVSRSVRAELVVLLNLTRDQLDRYAEVRRLAGVWRAALDPAAAGAAGVPAVVANADDPLVVWAATPAPEVAWVAAGLRWRQDAVACPACGEIIGYRDGSWACRGCSLRRPAPSWTLNETELITPGGVSVPFRLSVPGTANRGNAALAAAAASRFGVPAEAALTAMSAIDDVEGRYARTRYAGRDVRLILAKNPAGWQEALTVLQPAPAAVVVAVNARAADGRDPAWLWDVAFENLAGRPVTASGERARDVAVRLRYAGVDHVRIDSLAAALRAAAPHDGAVEVLANYTAFQQARQVVRDG
ncbi:MAG TPA: MurT ligase domain-containing protein [Mycobacteriales bacterium]|nr:MurT ligase domain-containing protein [Mycobacteriales bacterium]